MFHLRDENVTGCIAMAILEGNVGDGCDELPKNSITIANWPCVVDPVSVSLSMIVN